MLETRIKSIIIKNFRNHCRASVNIPSHTNIIAIIDKNGSGKTNILEAISLLSPGSGLKNASLKDMSKDQAGGEFIISHLVELGTSITQKIDIIFQNGKKKILVNDKAIGSHAELKTILGVIWLTPEIQVDISTSHSARRKFFDRMVFNFHSDHAKLISDYENLLKERMKILEMTGNFTSNSWLDSIEKQITNLTVQIVKNRHDLLQEMKRNISQMQSCNLELDISCDAYKIFMEKGENSSSFIAHTFFANRNQDKISGRTNFSCHRYNLIIKYGKNNLEIDHCSSGEKKYLITTFLVLVAKSIIMKTGHSPIILIDEFTSFIDSNFRSFLIDTLTELRCQIWLTGTDIPEIKQDMHIFNIQQISKDL